MKEVNTMKKILEIYVLSFLAGAAIQAVIFAIVTLTIGLPAILSLLISTPASLFVGYRIGKTLV